MSSYFDFSSWTRALNNRKALEKTNPQNPVLNDEDESFLQRIASQEAPAPPLPDAKPVTIADDGTEKEASETQKEAAEMILPTSPGIEEVEGKKEEEGEKAGDKVGEKRTWGSYMPSVSVPSMPSISAIGSLRGKKSEVGDQDTKEQESALEQARKYAAGLSGGASNEEKENTEDKTEETTEETVDSKPEVEQDAVTDTKAKSEPETNVEESKAEESKAEESKAEETKTEEATGESQTDSTPADSQTKEESAPQEESDKPTEAPRTWASYIPAMPTIGRNTKGKEAETPQQPTTEDNEREVSVLLDRLNLSAINNRVFSFSQDSQKLYQSFTLILKDMVNGVPTAYDDLEKLIRQNERQLEQMFGNMPPFVQTLVKSLPAKFASSLGPEVMAAAAGDKPGNDLKMKMEAASHATGSTSSSSSGLNIPGFSKKQKQKRNVPGLNTLAKEKGAVASMLSNILNFLKLRFPAFVTGTNVLMSLAVFILLFVFWYSHKRGKETRLLKEGEESARASAAASETSDLEEEDEGEEDENEKQDIKDDVTDNDKKDQTKNEKDTADLDTLDTSNEPASDAIDQAHQTLETPPLPLPPPPPSSSIEHSESKTSEDDKTADIEELDTSNEPAGDSIDEAHHTLEEPKAKVTETGS